MNDISKKSTKCRFIRYSGKFVLLKMIVFLSLISAFTMNVAAENTQKALISLSEKDITLKNILSKIERQTSYLFIINSNVDLEKKVSLEIREASLIDVLNRLFKNSEVKYSVEGSHVVLSKKEQAKNTIQAGEESIVFGTVTDSGKEALIGVSVVYKGATYGGITDFEGKFSFKVPDKTGMLVFSYVGYQTLTIPVEVGREMEVVLKDDTKILSEVVVTAMGIERKATSLTYATQQVQGKELTRAKDANFINALQGKTAGLVITPNASGAGGSSKVLLRGNQSVLGENQPLIVIDGVPMADRNSTQITTDLLEGGNGVDGGDGLSNINPDDIASITILKGPNAAALYGARAGSGAIIITTKRGAEGKVKIDVSSSILFESPLVTPRFQNDYGGVVETYGDRSLNPNLPETKRRLTAQSWGPRIGALSGTTLSEIPYARNSAQDNVTDFFRTGTNFNNSIAVSGGTKLAQSYFSYGHTQSDGMVPNNAFYRHNATFRQGVSFFDERLKFDFSGSYIIQKAKNRPGSGLYGNPLYSLYTMPRNSSIAYFEDYSETYGDLYTVLSYNEVYRKQGVKGPIQNWPWIEGSEDTNNPHWYMNRLIKQQRRERMFATLGATVKITQDLVAQTRLKVDRSNDTNETKTYQGTRAKSIYNSIYEDGRYTSNQVFADVLATYTKKLNEDLNITVNTGASTQKDDFRNLDMVYWMKDTTAVPNKFEFDNLKSGALASEGPTIAKNKSLSWANAVFATALVGYQDKLFLDATYRRDWHYFYTYFHDVYGFKPYYDFYSVGANAVLDQILAIQSEKLNFLKIRTSYSDVGNPLTSGAAIMTYNPSQGSASQAAFRPWKSNPGSERVRSFEIGIDGLFFNRTIGLDLTLYNSELRNQWLPKKAATGGNLPVNSGRVRNQGIETSLSYTFEPTINFFWKTSLNYSYNKSKVLQTYDGEDRNKPAEISDIFQGGLKIYQIVGKPYGELYGRSYEYEADGKTIRTDRMGAPVLSTDYTKYLGNANSPHHLGWSNTVEYKNVSFYCLIDGKIGGKVISYTEARMDMFGVSERTGDARNAGIYYMKKTNMGGETVMQSVPGLIMPDGNIAPVEEYYKKIGGGEPVLENYVYDATNFRVREISAGYTFKSLLGVGKDLSLSLVARNLLFLYRDSPVDPDVAVSTANGYDGIEAFALPSSRSFGVNLKMSF